MTAMRSCLLCVALLAGVTRQVGGAEGAPGFSLPDAVHPTRYALDLRIFPERPFFDGTVTIDLDVRRPVSTIWLNARTLIVRQAKLQRGDGISVPLKIQPGTDEVVGFVAPELIRLGHSRITIDYTGRADEQTNDGVFRRKIAGDW